MTYKERRRRRKLDEVLDEIETGKRCWNCHPWCSSEPCESCKRQSEHLEAYKPLVPALRLLKELFL